MEQPLDLIYKTIQRLTGLHRQLLDTVRMERDALVAAELSKVQEATGAKQGLIEAIQQAETDRLRLLGELALKWKKPVRELTLSSLVIAIQGDDPKGAELLRSSFNALTILIQRITEQNDHNQALVQTSLEHIGKMKRNVLGEASAKSATYTQQGQKNNAPPGSRLISREA